MWEWGGGVVWVCGVCGWVGVSVSTPCHVLLLRMDAVRPRLAQAAPIFDNERRTPFVIRDGRHVDERLLDVRFLTSERELLRSYTTARLKMDLSVEGGPGHVPHHSILHALSHLDRLHTWSAVMNLLSSKASNLDHQVESTSLHMRATVSHNRSHIIPRLQHSNDVALRIILVMKQSFGCGVVSASQHFRARATFLYAQVSPPRLTLNLDPDVLLDSSVPLFHSLCC